MVRRSVSLRSSSRTISTSRLEHSHHPVDDVEDDDEDPSADDAVDEEAIEADAAAERIEPDRPGKRRRSVSAVSPRQDVEHVVKPASMAPSAPAVQQALRDQATTISELFATLSPAPALTALASIMVAGGMPDRGDALFDQYDQDDLEAFLAELGASVTPVARVLCLSRVATERARRASLLI